MNVAMYGGSSEVVSISITIGTGISARSSPDAMFRMSMLS